MGKVSASERSLLLLGGYVFHKGLDTIFSLILTDKPGVPDTMG